MARSQEFLEAIALAAATLDGWAWITSHKHWLRAVWGLRAFGRPTRGHRNVLKDALEKPRLDGYRESEGFAKRGWGRLGASHFRPDLQATAPRSSTV